MAKSKSRKLADFISDSAIDTAELADSSITPAKLDSTGSYTVADLTVSSSYPDLVIEDSDGTNQSLTIQQVGGASMIKPRSGSNDGELYITGAVSGNNILKTTTGGDVNIYASGGSTTDMLQWDASEKMLKASRVGIFTDGGARDDVDHCGLLIGQGTGNSGRYGISGNLSKALVLQNPQGSTNEAMLLNDAGTSSTTTDIFSISHNQDITSDGTSDTAVFDGSEAGWNKLFGVTAAGYLSAPSNVMFCAYQYDTGTDNEYPISGTNGTLTANTTSVNVGNHYNTSTGRFTAPMVGYYLLSFNLSLYVQSGTGADNSVGWGFDKNGSHFNWTTYSSGMSVTQSTPFVIGQDSTTTLGSEVEIGAPSLSVIVGLNQGDYIQVGWQNMSNNLGIRSFIFSGMKIG